ncbi:uncharacterized protein PFL1_03262 [Pseudozyma flocculosa PF-1]|uniref:Related to IES1 - Subunit 1 of the INO80 chromatin remodeling complex n=2 Tax=Pseudozyma flocculosa TaxID=84751 RepID=A0A5C3F8I6_9BASI|nr:uncharacterized protein PFL1_03262 [Pseudozyma flocculosa PF-1]EPQ28972.1 hypothetical protein PFL1_03262 [Pseudozyma flocculosa PF-1]SPO39965.1 related to IES1 - Subunit 1 of the INO80 chromatin remodeling complex [Pseudozyma flocculosa]
MAQRNLPVKRHDGDPLSRADVQHNLLCRLFADTRRVFTNPRPGTEPRPGSSNITLSNGAHVPTPVWPYGTSKGCTRRSDETPEEFEAWRATKARYDKWKRRMARRESAARAAEQRKARDAMAAASSAAADDASRPGSRDKDKTPNEEEDELAATASDNGIDDDGDQADQADAAASGDEAEDADDDEPLDDDAFAKPGCDKLTFKELYLEALLNSGKCTKSMRDKIILDEEYAEDFAKVCLLVNVGRINTTLAFYPEMKTVLRSYHPIPSMQNNENTRRNMQDAPRMKSLLKAVLLDHERASAPTAGPTAGQPPPPPKPPKVNLLSDEAPGDFRETIKRYRDGTRPPTSVVTLIFLFSLHANDVTATHFPQPHDSHALFYPHPSHPLTAKQRAEAFLWLLYHYLEGPASEPPAELENPFDDDTSKAAAKLAREAWDALSEQDKQKHAGLPWKGLPNPQWAKWKAQEDKRRESGGAGAVAAAQSKDGAAHGRAEATGDGDGDVSMKDDDAGDDAKATSADGEILVEPPSHTHRLLVPALDVVPFEQAVAENLDAEEEVRWGKQMQSERAAFLARFQEEEAVKNAGGQAAGSPAPSTGTAGGKGRGRGALANLKREEHDRGATPSDADGSFASTGRGRRRVHPLASATSAPDPKRSRIAQGYDDSPETTPFHHFPGSDGAALDDGVSAAGLAGGGGGGGDDYYDAAAVNATRTRPSLWDLDLSLSRAQMHESLPQLAWTRILDRAQRGVGDACYESDDDEFAEEEAQAGERSRGEVLRILKSLRAVVPEDVFREHNEAIAQAWEGEGRRMAA